MRARLLEATIDCLVEFGYAGTTTSRIASRAGATRGALIHHFQSKSELMAESVRHLAFKRTQAVLEELMAMDQSVDPIERYLDVLWRIHQGPLFIAVVELLIAARTEPDLRVHLDQFERWCCTTCRRSTCSATMTWARRRSGVTSVCSPWISFAACLSAA